MEMDMIKYICCPLCKEDLEIESSGADENSDEIQTGWLRCQSCSVEYPIRKGLPIFVDDDDNYASSFGMQWNKHAKAQIDKYNGLTFSRDRFYAVTGWPQNMKGESVLEVGSGAGRFTQIICETGAEVFSFDSSNAVFANRNNNKQYKNLTLFQGDIYRLPLKTMLFDKVFCFGVLQHTPDVKKAFMSLAEYVKPNGELVIDIYSNRLTALLSWKYLLRPITKRLDKELLYNFIIRIVPALLPFSTLLQKIFGNLGWRLLPIANYSHLEMPDELRNEWAVLDTFDMYSPIHDHPQSKGTLKKWFIEAGFRNIIVENSANGIIGKGIKPIGALNLSSNIYTKTDTTITALMAVYNGERWIRDAINSVLSQSEEDFELVIVNDGSTDSTASIIESFDDERLVVINQTNIGLTKSLNKGLNIAKGEFIARIDADDICMPGRFYKQKKALVENPDVVLVGSNAILIDVNNNEIGRAGYPLTNDMLLDRLRTFRSVFPHSSVFFRKDIVIKEGGYNEYFVKSQDNELYLRLSGRYLMSGLDEFLIKLRINPDSLTYSDDLQLKMGLASLICYYRRKNGLKDFTKSKRDEWDLFLRELEQWIDRRNIRRKREAKKRFTLSKVLLKQKAFLEYFAMLASCFESDPLFFLYEDVNLDIPGDLKQFLV
jgi:glycosyltransferase involved in cell wall biosynthesis/SAM-dependent methyltransferase